MFRSRLDKSPDEDLLTAAATMLATFPNLGLEWSDLDWLRGQTALPILVKGVLTADDAREALAHGVDGIVVSNHGGRQVDGAVAALDALVEVRDALPDAVVLMDGGIRCAADVLKAMALGADAVLLGRPYAYALAVGGVARGGGADPEPDGRDRPHARARRRALGPRPRPFVADQGVVLERARRGGARGDLASTSPARARCAVRIDATGVCHSDLHVIQEDGWGHTLPVLLGHEGAGTVERVGENVEGLAEGDRVVLGWHTACGACASCARGAAAPVQEAADCVGAVASRRRRPFCRRSCAPGRSRRAPSFRRSLR